MRGAASRWVCSNSRGALLETMEFGGDLSQLVKDSGPNF